MPRKIQRQSPAGQLLLLVFPYPPFASSSAYHGRDGKKARLTDRQGCTTPATPSTACHPERTRRSFATEGESKDPEDPSLTMPFQGILAKMRGSLSKWGKATRSLQSA